MRKWTLLAVTQIFAFVILLAAPLALGQWQVNPQTNTGIYAGPGPTAVRYAGEFTGANTAFNQSSHSSDTRIGFANSGAYAANGVINGGTPADQNYQVVPDRVNTTPNPSIRYSSAPSSAMVQGQAGSGPINAQVSGVINGRAN